ncbi:MAG: hypothetical protein ACRC1H_06280 [Caldilineaceae bacterium]
MNEIDRIRADLDRMQAERDESAVEVVRLIGLIDDLTVERDILRHDNANHRADVHSCHAGCTRAGCVNERLRDVLRACQRHLACNACTSDLVALYERVRAALEE